MQKFNNLTEMINKIESEFSLAQTFQGKFKISIKKFQSWLAESKHHKKQTPDTPVLYRPSTNRFLRNDASMDPYPIWAEPEAWPCGGKHTAGSAGTMSLHAKWSGEKRP
jgi:hypothetical protein